VIGFGTWAFGGAWGFADLQDSSDAIPHGLELGSTWSTRPRAMVRANGGADAGCWHDRPTDMSNSGLLALGVR
jgi:hypothetical protein